MLGGTGPFNVEFRMALPLNMDKAQISYKVPMGVLHVGQNEVSRTIGISRTTAVITSTAGGWVETGSIYDSDTQDTQPREVQNFISANDEQAGLGVSLSSSVAAVDWVDIYASGDNDPNTWPHPSMPQQPILQPVLLATRHSVHGDPTSPWYGFKWDEQKLDQGIYEVISDTLSFIFSLKSHAPGWEHGFHFGHEANNPLRAVYVDNPSGSDQPLPESGMSFARVTKDGKECRNVIITALKKWEPTDDDESRDEPVLILRLNEIAGTESTIRVALPFDVVQAESVNMIEESWDVPTNDGLPDKHINVTTGPSWIELTIGPYAIETVKVTIATEPQYRIYLPIVLR
jgi:alpha-mannosidase